MTNLIAPSFACSTLSCAEPLASKVYSVLRERHMRYAKTAAKCLANAAFAYLGSRYETVRPMPRKIGIRCAFP